MLDKFDLWDMLITNYKDMRRSPNYWRFFLLAGFCPLPASPAASPPSRSRWVAQSLLAWPIHKWFSLFESWHLSPAIDYEVGLNLVLAATFQQFRRGKFAGVNLQRINSLFGCYVEYTIEYKCGPNIALVVSDWKYMYFLRYFFYRIFQVNFWCLKDQSRNLYAFLYQ